MDRNSPEIDNGFYKTSKIDIAIISVVLLFSFSYIAWKTYGRLFNDEQKSDLVIYQKDKLLEKVSMDTDRVLSLLNGRMRVEIKNGKARVLDSDCPQNICVHMGWVKYSGQSIVCVPNQVTVEVKSSGSQILDGVSY